MSDYKYLLTTEKESNIRAKVKNLYEDAYYPDIVLNLNDREERASKLRRNLAELSLEIGLMKTHKENALKRLDAEIIDQSSQSDYDKEATINA